MPSILDDSDDVGPFKTYGKLHGVGNSEGADAGGGAGATTLLRVAGSIAAAAAVGCIFLPVREGDIGFMVLGMVGCAVCSLVLFAVAAKMKGDQ